MLHFRIDDFYFFLLRSICSFLALLGLPMTDTT